MKYLFLLFTLWYSCGAVDSKEPHDADVKMVSPVVEVKPNIGKMPSYADPSKYSIAKIGAKYFVMFPHGTLSDVWHNSAEDAQADINKRANASYRRWVDSGGRSY